MNVSFLQAFEIIAEGDVAANHSNDGTDDELAYEEEAVIDSVA